MTHHMLTGTIAALALVGSTAAQAQGVYIVEPYAAPPVYVAPPVYAAPPVYVAPPVVVAPAPRYVAPPAAYVVPRDDYAYVPPAYVAPPATGYVTVDAVTGRRCTIKPDGYRWCWTP
jgi:hypothetical protein